MIDTTPDFREQLALLHRSAPGCRLAGILLTHAHMGHYTGLIQLGREAWNTQRMPVYAPPRMAAFLMRACLIIRFRAHSGSTRRRTHDCLALQEKKLGKSLFNNCRL